MTNSEQVYRKVAAASFNDGIFLVDSSEKVVFANSALDDLLKLNGTQLIDRSHWFTFRKIAELTTDARSAEERLQQAYHLLDESPTLTLHTRNSPGSRLQVKLGRNQADSWDGWVCTVRDVTEDWRDITKQSEYLSVVLRSLRTRQAEVKGLMDMLLTSHHYWDERQRNDFLVNIDKNVGSMNQILEYGQETLNLYLGGVRLSRRPTNLKPRLQQALSSMAMRMSDRVIEVDLPDDMPEVEIDSGRFDQIFNYLLTNAIASSPAGGKIRVAMWCEGTNLVVGVTDQGQSLSNTQLTQILDTPTGISLADRDELVAANLGLYNARELIRMHGGQLWAECTPGIGTTVYCGLPLSRKVPVDTKALSRFDIAVTRSPRKALRYKVLIADDDPAMMKLMRVVLERNGYQVIEASSGKMAFEVVADKKPDLVLMDMYFPDANGIEIASQLREFSSVPIIMMSVNERPEDIARALDMGIDDYLVKPPEWPELLARVRANIRRSTSTKTVGAADCYEFDALCIDFIRQRVLRSGEEIHLATKEYKVLALLAANAGHVLTHSEILQKVWGPEYGDEKQYLWVVSSRLRKKLEDDQKKPKYILTKDGFGYYMPGPGQDDMHV